MNEPALILALDTSTRIASVAVFDGQLVLSETTWLAGREHSTRLMTEVDVALERVGHTIEQLTGLVVARGPGSFTGVRVALSVAKGLAGGLAIPAWGVNSLDALALAAQPSTLPLRVVLEAGRGRYATARYVGDDRVSDMSLATIDQLVETIDEPTVVLGEVRPEDRPRLAANRHVRLAPHAAAARRAGFLAEAGWRMAQAGDPGDARALDAVYVA